MDEKLRRGDEITIWFSNNDWPQGYAQCTYSGKRNGKHYFTSDTYGWRYIVDVQANTVICDKNPEHVYQINNDTCWVRCLPQQ